MADFKFRVEGANRIAADFASYVRESPGTFDKTVGRWAKRVANQLKTKAYPPTRPGQRYKRTRTLKRAWQAVRERSAEWAITNRARRKGTFYASFVVGDRQAWMHKGRWWIGSEEVEERSEDLVKMLGSDIERLIF